MDYLSAFHLKKEPFSNSPDPEFFFRSCQHVRCLQKLEISIRLRRGLNVVIGDIGTGKTTLCRQLIRLLDGDDRCETHLILDPSFATPLEFLSTIAGIFQVPIPPVEGGTERDIKEALKHYLFRRGVDEGKTVVLIVDEGQKIPDFCLEILRELLNYETNESKLLQIVVFAQKEFELTLKWHPNFADRINSIHRLGVLSFRQSRAMIRFRLEQAKNGHSAPDLFSFLGYWHIYRSTGGYPRRIVHLCHQVLVAMIVQNRARAGWSLVRSCAGSLYLDNSLQAESSGAWRRKVTIAALALLLAGLPAGFFLRSSGKWSVRFSGVANDAGEPSGQKGAATLQETAHRTESPPTSSPEPASQTTHRAEPLDPSQQPEPIQGGSALSSSSGGAPPVPPPAEMATVPLASAERMALPAPLLDGDVPDGVSSGDGEIPQVPEFESGSVSKTVTAEPVSVSNAEASQVQAPPTADPREAGSMEASPDVRSGPSEAENPYPESLGTLMAVRGDSLSEMVRRVYGVYDNRCLDAIERLNPSIKNLDRLKVGQAVRFPAVAMHPAPPPSSRWWVQLFDTGALQEAYEVMRRYPGDAPPARMLAYWNPRDGLGFAVVIRESFPDEPSARRALENITALFGSGREALRRWDTETVFFAE